MSRSRPDSRAVTSALPMSARTGVGEPFSARHAMVITVRNAHVVHSRDYAGPFTSGRLPAG